MIIHAYSSKFKGTKIMHNDKSLFSSPSPISLVSFQNYFMYIEAKYK